MKTIGDEWPNVIIRLAFCHDKAVDHPLVSVRSGGVFDK